MATPAVSDADGVLGLILPAVCPDGVAELIEFVFAEVERAIDLDDGSPGAPAKMTVRKASPWLS